MSANPPDPNNRYKWTAPQVESFEVTPADAAAPEPAPEGAKQYFSDEGYIAGTEPREDAPFHAEMLEGPDAEAADAFTSMQSAVRVVQNLGIDPASAARLYGVDPQALQMALQGALADTGMTAPDRTQLASAPVSAPTKTY